ncbi:MAG: DUF616 domain-containing protein [Patescibacteria group bacterium]|nr:DUF616 domain-containing protein [Patescibacteria group bacterium]
MKRVIYTSIIGGYDKLKPIPKNNWGIKFICLTDSNDIESTEWEIIKINKVDQDKRSLENRRHKMFPEKFFDAEQSIYIDGNIKIINNPNILFDKYLSNFDIAVPKHFSRNCSYDEIQECKKNNMISATQASNICTLLENSNFPKNIGLYENNIILRNHNKVDIIKTMEAWYYIFSRLAQRDQLSFTYCAWKNKISVGEIAEGPRFTSQYFKIIPHNSKGNKNAIKSIRNHIRMNSNLNIFYKATDIALSTIYRFITGVLIKIK